MRRGAPRRSFDVPHTWTQGVYELRIVPVSRFMLPATIPLVVRDPTPTTRLVEVLSTNTWQMYNMWGGLDAYSSPEPSRVVSLNRPYNASQPCGPSREIVPPRLMSHGTRPGRSESVPFCENGCGGGCRRARAAELS